MNWDRVKKKITEQAKKLGVPVRYEKDKAYTSKQEIVLPPEVPTTMAGALLGIWYHEQEHWVAKDAHWGTRYAGYLHDPLNVVTDIRNDHRALRKHQDGKRAYISKVDYVERKIPPKERMKQHVANQITVELIFRAFPNDVGRGKGTRNPVVKRWFKKHKEWHKCIAECRQVTDDNAGYKRLVFWAEWLVRNVMDEVLDKDAEALTPEEMEKAISSIGGLGVGTGCSMDEVDPHDLEVPVPKMRTVDDLAEFLREAMEEMAAFETGALNPMRLPDFWRDPEDLFRTDQEKKNKKVRVYLICDASGSMGATLPSCDTRYQACAKAMGLICEAVERVTNEFGIEATTEVTAFREREKILKEHEDAYDKSTLMNRFTSFIGGGTQLSIPVKRIEAIPSEAGTKDFVFVISDGQIMQEDRDLLDKTSGDKRWVLFGIGKGCRDNSAFKHVANDTDELEKTLADALKEALA